MSAKRIDVSRARAFGFRIVVAAAGTLFSVFPLTCEHPHAHATAASPDATRREAPSSPSVCRKPTRTLPSAPRSYTPVMVVSGSTSALVYPAQAESRALVVMLHGMCSHPERYCTTVARALEARAWLICPRGALSCRDGDATWEADPTRTIEKALQGARAQIAGVPERFELRTLVGFSLGAMRAASLAKSGEWHELVLIGARVPPAIERSYPPSLKRAVFVAGDKDAAAAHMRAMTRRFGQVGIESHYVSLGPHGHELPEVAAGPLRLAFHGLREQFLAHARAAHYARELR